MEKLHKKRNFPFCFPSNSIYTICNTGNGNGNDNGNLILYIHRFYSGLRSVDTRNTLKVTRFRIKSAISHKCSNTHKRFHINKSALNETEKLETTHFIAFQKFCDVAIYGGLPSNYSVGILRRCGVLHFFLLLRSDYSDFNEKHTNRRWNEIPRNATVKY